MVIREYNLAARRVKSLLGDCESHYLKGGGYLKISDKLNVQQEDQAGPKISAAFLILLKRRTDMLLFVAKGVRNNSRPIIPVKKSFREHYYYDQARSNRSKFMTLFQAAIKSLTNFSWASAAA